MAKLVVDNETFSNNEIVARKDDEIIAPILPNVFPCQICQDRSSGIHYGIPSCDACTGFFKRSVRRSRKFVCQEGGKCSFDKGIRNRCRACRLQKCLKMGMKKDEVWHSSIFKVEQQNLANNKVSKELILGQELANSSANSEKPTQKNLENRRCANCQTPLWRQDPQKIWCDAMCAAEYGLQGKVLRTFRAKSGNEAE